ncbi:MAG: tetratricopeptide repeat protein [Bacteroidetes bacterium]|nr:tetratricopeptide repeat protein [Bacteroidota bacterium]
MKYFLSLPLSIFLSVCLWAQTPSIKYIDAQTHINNGIQLHDNEKYEAAIAEYRKVNPNDSLYSLALYEIALSYSAMDKNEDALNALNAMAANLGTHAVDYYILRASLLDKMDRTDESIEMYEEVYQKYSHLSNVGYSYALCLFRAGKYDEAEEVLQRAIRINPYHYRSHYLLGAINYAKGRTVPAMLCLAFATNLGNETQCYNTMVAFEGAISGVFADEINKTSKGGVQPASTDAINSRFTDLETMIKSNFVQNKNFKPKTKIDLTTTRQLQFLIENVHVDASATDIYNQFYVPFFSELTKKNYIEPYIVNSMRFSNDKTVAATAKKNKTPISNYLNWAGDYINKGRTNLFNPADKNYYTFFRSGGIDEFGQYADAGKKILTGTWTVYYNNGQLKAIVNYSPDGSEADFVSYNTMGGIERKGALKNGELHGVILNYHTNGVLASRVTYTKEESIDTAYFYNPSGQLTATNFYKNNEHTGKITYFDNGQKRVVSNYVDGKLNGKYDTYFANGTQSLDGVAKNDNLDGVATYHHRTGARSDLQNYRNGKQVGEQKEWYPNGQLKSVHSYNNAGLLSGWYKDYYSNGVLKDSVFYNDKGELHGTAYYYDTDGKLYYTTTYKNGKEESYIYYNKAGEKTRTSSLKDGTFATYYPNGAVRKTGVLKNGLNEGTWTGYDSQGRVWYTENFQKDKTNGEFFNYYSNGTVFVNCYYSDDELDGLYVKYYESGNKKSEGYYKAGKKVGEWKEFLDNGVVSEISYYGNGGGELQGWEEEYTVDGKLKLKKQFVEGRLYAYITYDSTGQITNNCELKNGNGLLLLKHSNGAVRYRAPIVGGKYEGVLEKYSPNGVLTFKGNYIDDVEDGLFVWYYGDGKKSSEENYVLGKKHGISRDYYPEGGISKEEEYMLGTLLKSTSYYKNGGKMAEYIYDSNGDLTARNHYAMDGSFRYGYLHESGYVSGYTYLDKAGNPVEKKLDKDKNTLVAYYQNGNKSIEAGFNYGRLDGTCKTWHTNGAIHVEANYTNGEYNGEYKSYAPNGTLTFTANYVNGDKQGTAKSYYDNGKLEYEEQYECNSRHGVCKYYDKNGKLQYTREYVSGLMVAEIKH